MLGGWDCEVAVVGGGPAGLSAALVLGRSRRKVVLFDSGHYRNDGSRMLHGFLGHEGIHPAKLRQRGREELAVYPSVILRDLAVVDATPLEQRGFDLLDADGGHTRAKKLLLATGLVEELPPLPGAAPLVGRSLFHCPYCDGWELRERPLVAYGRGDRRGAAFALELRQWSQDVVLCSDGPAALSPPKRQRLAHCGIPVIEERIERLVGDGQGLRLLFVNGATLERRAMFYQVGRHPGSDLAGRLGCPLDDHGGVATTGPQGQTPVDGLYVAGDASKDTLLAVVGAGEGAAAAVAINTELLAEDLPD